MVNDKTINKINRAESLLSTEYPDRPLAEREYGSEHIGSSRLE